MTPPYNILSTSSHPLSLRGRRCRRTMRTNISGIVSRFFLPGIVPSTVIARSEATWQSPPSHPLCHCEERSDVAISPVTPSVIARRPSGPTWQSVPQRLQGALASPSGEGVGYADGEGLTSHQIPYTKKRPTPGNIPPISIQIYHITSLLQIQPIFSLFSNKFRT